MGRMGNDFSIFALTVKSIRKEKGLTLSEVGKRIRVSGAYLSMIENGKFFPKNPKTFLKIDRALGANGDLMMFVFDDIFFCSKCHQKIRIKI